MKGCARHLLVSATLFCGACWAADGEIRFQGRVVHDTCQLRLPSVVVPLAAGRQTAIPLHLSGCDPQVRAQLYWEAPASGVTAALQLRDDRDRPLQPGQSLGHWGAGTVRVLQARPLEPGAQAWQVTVVYP